MTDEHTVAIAFSEFPDPVVAYAMEGDEPRITATNEAFEARFSAVSSETPVTDLFERFSVIESNGDEEPVTHVSRGDSVSIYLDDSGERGPFFVRVLPTSDDTGYLVFSDVSGYPDITDTPAVSRDSSVISHDLRNHLDVAKAHLTAAQETGAPEHFAEIANAHDRMERIIRDVLTITRDEAVVTASEQVTIRNTVTEAWQSVDTGAATLDIGNALPTVTADADRVRRLFENLFRNSAEHGSDVDSRSEAGTAESQVTVTVGPLENGFYVSDDGAGIPSDERDKITRPGYSTRSGGTGLGLAIVEQIVAAHGWELTVTSATDGGARFEIGF